ncbi:hypothetical protein PT300_11820 [Enterobacteriaceae bacterium ESL0689]|nr:hypothetical protein [Enterobacteriaceae bacterium ESL0689]
MKKISELIIKVLVATLVIIILVALAMSGTVITAGVIVCYLICKCIAYIKEREQEHLNKRGAK